MDHLLSSAGLRLRYLCDKSSLLRLDAYRILDDLAEPDTRYAMSWWFAATRLADLDHVVIATDCRTGRYVAFLAANDGATAAEAFLDLQAAFVVGDMRGGMLMRRMLAYAISRISLLGSTPGVIAARTSLPICYQTLALFAKAMPGATVFPTPDTTVVDLLRAGLARRIARRLAPNCEYDAATGAIHGARLTSATCFAREADVREAVERMFEASIGTSDQMLVVVDLRAKDKQVVTAQAEQLVRKRWKQRAPVSIPDARRPLPAPKRQVPTLTA